MLMVEPLTTGFIGNFNRSVESFVDTVKLQQRKGVDFGQVVNGNNCQVAAVQHLTKGQSAYSAKTVDAIFFIVGLNSIG